MEYLWSLATVLAVLYPARDSFSIERSAYRHLSSPTITQVVCLTTVLYSQRALHLMPVSLLFLEAITQKRQHALPPSSAHLSGQSV